MSCLLGQDADLFELAAESQCNVNEKGIFAVNDSIVAQGWTLP